MFIMMSHVPTLRPGWGPTDSGRMLTVVYVDDDDICLVEAVTACATGCGWRGWPDGHHPQYSTRFSA